MAEGKKTTGTRRTAKAAAAPEAAVSAPAAKPAGKASTKTDAAPAASAAVESASTKSAGAEAAVVAAPVVAEPAPTNGHGAPTAVSPEEKAAMIAHAAYLRAERRQFAPGNDQEDWFEAEREIEALLSQGGNA